MMNTHTTIKVTRPVGAIAAIALLGLLGACNRPDTSAAKLLPATSRPITTPAPATTPMAPPAVASAVGQ